MAKPIHVQRTIHGESQFIGSALRHFLVGEANPTVILERSEGSKSEMRVTVLFLPALILRSAKASLKNDSGVGAVQKTILRVALESRRREPMALNYECKARLQL